MVITMPFGLKDVLVHSESIPVVHITKLLNKVVHQLVVLKLFVIDKVSLLLDHVIETEPIREVELIIDFNLKVTL